MIDWLEVGGNGVWIGGLAVILACLSWANWLALRSGARLRACFATPGLQAWLNLGLTLLSVGLLLTSRSVLERVLWAAFLVAFAAQAFVALRNLRRVTPPVVPPVAPGPSHGMTSAVRIGRVANGLIRLEPWLLLAALPFLMFPQRFTALLLPLLALPWLARKGTQGRFTARTPMDGPILVLLLMLPISLWVSVDVQRSLLKFYGLMLGFAVFYGLVNHVRRPAQAWMVGLGLALAGLGVSTLALLGADWLGGKLLALPEVYGRLPRLVSGVPGSPPGGFNPNEVGAALCLFIPFVASLLFLGFSQSPNAGTVQPMPDHALIPAGLRRWVLFGLLALILLVMAGTLTLTQSRSAYLGIGVSLLVLTSFRRRWLWLALALGVLVGAVAWRYLGTERILSSFLALGSERNVSTRFEIWQRALYMIQDFPYTGVGLNTFPLVANTLYPLFSLAPERVLQLAHAHNAFLQVAVDLGIPGLVAYLALLLGFGAAWWTAYRRFAPGPLRALCVGLLCAIVAYHVYGLTDCITLGAKPGVAIWAMLGLLAALTRISLLEDAAQPRGRENAQ